ncbi:MAG: hypothetical protein CO093_05445 [Alphaproteobacteria bacterium CG_4_9_14_3_um_filter_47_13]|nr:MAG: hypothetical protein CO093_05445 [Alphaproteobacteria bacterium CG_4_9_14_3_um_filter_47_13]
MVSDKKDDSGFELEDDDILNQDMEDDVPLHEGLSPNDRVENAQISADSGVDMDDSYDGDLDIDMIDDEEMDFSKEGDDTVFGQTSSLKKVVLPALAVVIALGIGGFIVMNPQILGGRSTALPQPEVPYIAQPVQAESDADFDPFASGEEQVAFPDITETEEFDVSSSAPEALPDPMFDESLPQPIVNQNETPRVPDSEAGIDGLTEDIAPPLAEVTELLEVTGDVAAVPEAPGMEPLQEEQEMAFSESIEESVHSEHPDVVDDPVAPLSTELTPMEEEPPVIFGEESSSVAFDESQAEVQSVSDVVPPAMPVQNKIVDAPAPDRQEIQNLNPVSETVISSPQPSSSVIAPASNSFYDGRIPTGAMVDVGPRKVDPELEPASQFVIVKKSHEAFDMESMLVSANRALKLKRYDSALEMFNQLYSKNQRDQRILMGRAIAQQNSGMIESAIKSYEEIFDINPNNADAMLNMLGLLRQQYPSVALRRLLDLYRKHPGNAGVAAQIGVTQADLGNNEEAFRYLGMAASQEPQNALHMFNMAIIADRTGDTKGAIGYYERALELDAIYSSGRSIPRDTIYNRLATLRRR